jgi:hypothetical protein
VELVVTDFKVFSELFTWRDKSIHPVMISEFRTDYMTNMSSEICYSILPA